MGLRRFSSADPLADLDDDLFLPNSVSDTPEESWSDKYKIFEWARYDWSRFDPKEYGYNIIRLMGDLDNNRSRSVHSGVYFAIVDRYHYRTLTEDATRWYPLVEYYRDEHGEKTDHIKRVVAHRNEGPRKSRRVVYMHRRIGDENEEPIRDHINGHSLDNRSCNLRPASFTLNSYNRRRIRTVHDELRPGVEWVTSTKKLELRTHVRGVIEIDGERIRSQETWPLEEQIKAQKWYLAKLREVTGHNKWVMGTKQVPLPKFPPEVEIPF